MRSAFLREECDGNVVTRKKTILSVVVFLIGIASALVFLLVDNRIQHVLNDLLLNYVNSRINVGKQHSSPDKARIEVGDLTYSVFSGVAHFRSIGIHYKDSTAESQTDVQLKIPDITASGLYIWHLLFGYGLQIQSIVINKPVFTFNSLDLSDSSEAGSGSNGDSSSCPLPKIPDLNEIVKTFLSSIPAPLAPLTLHRVEVINAHIIYNYSTFNNRLSSKYEDVNATITDIDFKNIEDVDTKTGTTYRAPFIVRVHIGRLRHSSQASGTAEASGLDINIGKTDTTLAFEKFIFRSDSTYTYRLYKTKFSFSSQSITIDSFSIHPTHSDAEYFSVSTNSADRFRIYGRGLVLHGCDLSAIKRQQGILVKTMLLKYCSLDALTTKKRALQGRQEKIRTPPPMLHEIINSIPCDLKVDTIHVNNMDILYTELWPDTRKPAVLYWKDVDATITGLSNLEKQQKLLPLTIHASGTFLGSASMYATVSFPLNINKYRVSASGGIEGFDIRQLNSFLPTADNVKIDRGYTIKAKFTFSIEGRKAYGFVDAMYRDLEFTLLDSKTRKSTLFTGIASWLANSFRIRSDNLPPDFKRGRINHVIRKNAAIVQTIWFPVRDGLKETIGF